MSRLDDRRERAARDLARLRTEPVDEEPRTKPRRVVQRKPSTPDAELIACIRANLDEALRLLNQLEEL